MATGRGLVSDISTRAISILPCGMHCGTGTIKVVPWFSPPLWGAVLTCLRTCFLTFTVITAHFYITYLCSIFLRNVFGTVCNSGLICCLNKAGRTLSENLCPGHIRKEDRNCFEICARRTILNGNRTLLALLLFCTLDFINRMSDPL